MSVTKKILIVCAQCDGEDVGESWCGFEWVSRLSKTFDVTVLTQRFPGHRPPSEQLPGVRIIEWDATPYLARYPRFNSAVKPWYPLFYARARRWIKKSLAEGARYDLLHHLTPMAMRYPSPCAGLDVPYVIGPVAGSVETPPGFLGELDTQPGFMKLRGIDGFRLRYDPLMRRTYESADTVICSAPYAAAKLAGLGLRRIEIETEVGIESVPAIPRDDQAAPGRLRMVYVGRIVRTKGLRDAIRALGELGDLPGVTLDVAGSGEDLEYCRLEAARLGVASRVTFLGRLARAEVEALYQSADLFLFPSFREATGIVLFEAMRHGLPVVTADNGGPGHIVNETCGIRVTPANPQQFACDLAAAIRRLAADPALRRKMGECARTRSLELSLWSNKIERLSGIYDAVAAKAARPVETGSVERLLLCKTAG